jgi:hypothetical protein
MASITGSPIEDEQSRRGPFRSWQLGNQLCRQVEMEIGQPHRRLGSGRGCALAGGCHALHID